MGRELMLDGLDYLREQMDQLQMLHDEWVFRAGPAPAPHPPSAVLVEGYHEGLSKQAGIVLLEEHIEDRSMCDLLIEKYRASLRTVEAAHDSRQ